jgi:hypothetical protein
VRPDPSSHRGRGQYAPALLVVPTHDSPLDGPVLRARRRASRSRASAQVAVRRWNLQAGVAVQTFVAMLEEMLRRLMTGSFLITGSVVVRDCPDASAAGTRSSVGTSQNTPRQDASETEEADQQHGETARLSHRHASLSADAVARMMPRAGSMPADGTIVVRARSMGLTQRFGTLVTCMPVWRWLW